MTLISLQCSPTELESLFSAINSPDDGGKEKLEETRSLKPVRKPAHHLSAFYSLSASWRFVDHLPAILAKT